MSMKGNLARSILCSLVTRVDFGWYCSIVGVRDSSEAGCFCRLGSADAEARVDAACGRAIRRITATEITVRSAITVLHDFIVGLGYGIAWPIFPQDDRTVVS